MWESLCRPILSIVALATAVTVHAGTFGYWNPTLDHVEIDSHSGYLESSNQPFPRYVDRIPADLNGDDRVDIVAKVSMVGTVWYQNTGSGWVDRIISGELPGNQLASGDVNGDGHVDILNWSPSRTLRWLRNSGANTPTFTVDTLINVTPSSMTLVDLNGDDQLDVIVVSGESELLWFENGGELIPSFMEHFLASAEIHDVATGDFNGDEIVDLLTAQSDGIFWYENSGGLSPTFTAHQLSAVSSSRVNTADIDGDNDDDVIGISDGTAIWLANAGLTVWKQRTVLETPLENPSAFEALDFDRDGNLDLVIDKSLFISGGGPAPTWTYDGWVGDRFADFDGNGFIDGLTHFSNVQINSVPGIGQIDPPYRYSSRLIFLQSENNFSQVGEAELIDQSGDGVYDPGEPGVLRVQFLNGTSLTFEEFTMNVTSLTEGLMFGEPISPEGPVNPGQTAEIIYPYTTDLEIPCDTPLVASFEFHVTQSPPLSISGLVNSEQIGALIIERTEAMNTIAVAIPDDDPTWTTSTLDMASSVGTLIGFSLILDLEHPYTGDLEVVLTHPLGNQITISEADEMEGINLQGTYPIPTFLGLDVDGTYTLQVRDLTPADTGTLHGWALVAVYEVESCTPWNPVDILDLLLGRTTVTNIFDENGDGKVDTADLVEMINGGN